MYFNNLPQGFGQAPQLQAEDLMNRPYMGYTQGIGSIAPQQNAPAQPAQASPAPQLGNIGGSASTAGTGSRQIAPLARHQPKMTSFAEGGVVSQTLGKHDVVAAGIAALQGKHPSPREALDAYDREFGPDATAELIRGYADGGVVSGPGSGVADLVPGSIDGREDVRIASGEYVIPAWAVAALGDGSTEAGARVLDAMVKRLREAGSELIKGSDPIKPNEFLPA